MKVGTMERQNLEIAVEVLATHATELLCVQGMDAIDKVLALHQLSQELGEFWEVEGLGDKFMDLVPLADFEEA